MRVSGSRSGRDSFTARAFPQRASARARAAQSLSVSLSLQYAVSPSLERMELFAQRWQRPV